VSPATQVGAPLDGTKAHTDALHCHGGNLHESCAAMLFQSYDSTVKRSLGSFKP
jgi:hypothetical protein